ncbi:MAG: metallophosphoesterase family protein [Chloroflexota bacterium]
MRIGLIADTHIPRDAKMLPPHVKVAFNGVDLILHAGDIYVSDVLDELEAIAPVIAALGNGDRELPRDHRVEDSHTLNIDGLKVGLTHAFDLNVPLRTFENAMEREFGGTVDVVVSGDTHIAVVERYKGVLLVNPGSPTLPNGLFELGTVGMLEIAEGKVSARIVRLCEFQLAFQRELVYRKGFGA